MSLPAVATRAQWHAARLDLLAEEKALTRARDAVSTRRRELPMVEVEEDYVFEGPAGPARLLDLFEGRRQLIVGHFMFDPEWEDGCPSCSAGADEVADGERVFTYSSYARGAEWTGGSYALDLTALGRQEEWEEPKGRADLARGARPDFAS